MRKETWYDEEEDIIGINLFKGEYWKSIELPQGIVIDISKNGEIIGIEIGNAKKVFSGKTKKSPSNRNGKINLASAKKQAKFQIR